MFPASPTFGDYYKQAQSTQTFYDQHQQPSFYSPRLQEHFAIAVDDLHTYPASPDEAKIFQQHSVRKMTFFDDLETQFLSSQDQEDTDSCSNLDIPHCRGNWDDTETVDPNVFGQIFQNKTSCDVHYVASATFSTMSTALDVEEASLTSSSDKENVPDVRRSKRLQDKPKKIFHKGKGRYMLSTSITNQQRSQTGVKT